MSNIKSFFTIAELENISAISAHTIRIWERRYQLFQPNRTSNNRRTYDLDDLQYLLNIDLLRKNGLKISKIAYHSREEVFQLAKEIIDRSFNNEYALTELKMAMYGFDANLFEQFFEKAMLENDFKTVFKNRILPFLAYISQYWQTNTVTIAHEHFISNLIYQKIQLQIAQLKEVKKRSSERTFVLFLPEEEMHEIGLLYLHYELRLKRYQTIYLGRSVPLKDLASLKALYSNICFVSNFTMNLHPNKLKTYLNKVNTFLSNTNHNYWAIGHNLFLLKDFHIPKKIKVYHSMEEVIDWLDSN